ncbi:MAG TPA: amino acid ABC transporter substrate-binding protein [Burkholderiales bacterium]|jgi:ABC-type amino acid transport substrate-binding protein|nr:amino acid ABC transporter substrate-binding protein [Burkholderiales bacterium]
MRFTSVIMVLAGLACTGHAGAADTLAKIKANGEIRLGYFAASAPFSYVGTDKSPQGYSVELCQRIAASVQRELGLAQLKTTWVELGLGERIESVRAGRIDIECGTTSWSFSRQQLVDFSLMTFIDGASLLATVDSGIKRITDAGGKRISVIRGTTTERALVAALAKEKMMAELVRVDTREQGFAMLTEGRVDAFASDRFLLLNAFTSLRSNKPLRLADEDFSVEPYALALPRDDARFRIAVNRALAEVFRSGEIAGIYDRWFGQYGQPSLLLSALFYLQQVPE